MQKTLFYLFLLFIAPLHAQRYADCAKAMEICKKQVYHIDKTGGEGQNNTEADFISCFMNGENYGQAEENSTWIKFEVAQSGTLNFAITPHKMDNDIDFVVFRLPPNGDCNNKQIVRCMAAGDSGGNALVSPCMGETGLRAGERASSRDAGCSDPNDNTWLAPLTVLKGEKYVILISNVSQAGPGFSIRFGGTAKLPCEDETKPEPKPTKPKPEPTKPVEKPAPAPPPVIATTPPAQPDVIGGRKVEVGESVKVKNRKIKVTIWDSQVEDGDIVSIFLDDKKMVDHLYLTLKPKEFEIELPQGKSDYYLTVYADDFGKAEPNTAMVKIFDGVREQTIDLVAGRKKQESVKITVE